jgi:hypothetical protein
MAIVSFSFLIKEINGPFGIISKLRNSLMINKIIGIFFYELFECYYCIGCHCGYLIYLLTTKISDWNIREFIIWTLVGGILSLFVMKIMEFMNAKL